MKKFEEAFIQLTSLFVIVVIVTPIVIVGSLRLIQEIGTMLG